MGVLTSGVYRPSKQLNNFECPSPHFQIFSRPLRDKQKTATRLIELLDYCRYSANPVGHLLYLIGYRDAERRELSDKTCTALQLTNHWQDIGRDLIHLNRIYIPLEDTPFGYTETDLIAQT